jgi:hypothetical protein
LACRFNSYLSHQYGRVVKWYTHWNPQDKVLIKKSFLIFIKKYVIIYM